MRGLQRFRVWVLPVARVTGAHRVVQKHPSGDGFPPHSISTPTFTPLSFPLWFTRGGFCYQPSSLVGWNRKTNGQRVCVSENTKIVQRCHKKFHLRGLIKRRYQFIKNLRKRNVRDTNRQGDKARKKQERKRKRAMK